MKCYRLFISPGLSRGPLWRTPAEIQKRGVNTKMCPERNKSLELRVRFSLNYIHGSKSNFYKLLCEIHLVEKHRNKSHFFNVECEL